MLFVCPCGTFRFAFPVWSAGLAGMGHLWLFLMLNLLLISVEFSDRHDGIPEVAFPIPSLPVASAGTRNSFVKATSGIPSVGLRRRCPGWAVSRGPPCGGVTHRRPRVYTPAWQQT